MQDKIFQSVFVYCTLLFSRKESVKENLLQLFFAIAWLAALGICEVIDIKILQMPQQKFACFSKNDHKSTQTRCKVCLNLESVLQQLTLALAESFLLTLNTFHTLL